MNKLSGVVVAAALLLAACSSSDSDPNTADAAGEGDTSAEALAPLDQVFGVDDLDVVADYAIDGDALVGDPLPEEAAPFERFTELFPANTRPEVTRFVAIRTPLEGGLDGIMDRNKLNPEEFVLALDVSGFNEDPAELDRTMIHEFAHLVTLRPTQIPIKPDTVDGCEIFAIEGAGCPPEASYLFAWDTKFWPTYTLAERDEEGAEANLDRFDESIYVTDYAATNPVEDFAESFADWVVKQDRPQGDEVVDEKLAFFEDYPELVTLRDTIRAAL